MRPPFYAQIYHFMHIEAIFYFAAKQLIIVKYFGIILYYLKKLKNRGNIMK
jgi:hypothetical protein